MNKLFAGIFILVFSINNASAISLDEAYQSAKSHSEVLKISELSLMQSEEVLSRTRGAFLPSISVEGVYDYRPDRTTFGKSISSFQDTVSLSLEQPLFQGGREYGLLSQFKQEKKRSEKNLITTKRELFLRVAEVYYQTLIYKSRVNNLEGVAKAYQSMIQDLKYRSKIGRTRKADLNSVQAQLAMSHANIEQAITDLELIQKDLYLLTGLQDVSNLENAISVAQIPNEIFFNVSKLDEQPEVQSAQLEVDALRSKVSAERSAYFPSLGLFSSYQLVQVEKAQNGSFIAGVQLKWNLFNGGVDRATISIANIEAEKKQYELKQMRKFLSNDIQKSHSKIKRLKSSVNSLEKAKTIVENNLKLQRIDYARGLVAQVQVFEALRALFEVKKSYDDARLSLSYEFIRSRVLTGEQDASL